MSEGYNEHLAAQWSDWVESSVGTRKNEIYPLIKMWLAAYRPRSVVDIGCGQGACSDIIPLQTIYTGVDPSDALIKRAKKLHPYRPFIHGTASNTHLPDEFVDAILSVWVWSHLEDLVGACKEMYRILKCSGRVLIVTANPDTYEERKTFYTSYVVNDGLLKGTFDLGGGKVLTDTTLYLHSKQAMNDALIQAGFEVVGMTGLGQGETGMLYLVIDAVKK
jgi:ubiquinone/menaquinone biosynthesis C-methylase UbiE